MNLFFFQLIFEAERGVGELSDIALDDIYIDDGVCATAEQGQYIYELIS